MKKTVVSLLILFSAVLASAGKPMAVFGHPSDVSSITKGLLKPVGIQYETPKKWLADNELAKYSVIYFGERRAAGAEYSDAIKNYVKNGGIVVFAGSAVLGFTKSSRTLTAAQDFLGFAYIGNMGKVKVEQVDFNNSAEAKALKMAGKSFTWQTGFNTYPTKIKSAKSLPKLFRRENVIRRRWSIMSAKVKSGGSLRNISASFLLKKTPVSLTKTVTSF